jgi:thiol-disulfide isomerase/thioredoxin
MTSASNTSKNPAAARGGFWTPLRVVLTCVVAGLVTGIGLVSCSNDSQPGSASDRPMTTASPSTAAAPNTVPPRIAGPVALTSEIRDKEVKTLDGDSLKLSDYDNKVVVLNIWATWCGPCRLEMPDLVKLSKEYKSRGLIVLGLATTYNERQGQEYVKEFVKSQNVTYKILWDDGSLAQPLVQIVNGRGVIPQSFVISRDGRIVKHFQGFSVQSTPVLMRQAVEEALNDKGKA